MRFLSNFGCKLIFMCSVNFWHQQDSNSLFKGSIGHVTSLCKQPIVMICSKTTWRMMLMPRYCSLQKRLSTVCVLNFRFVQQDKPAPKTAKTMVIFHVSWGGKQFSWVSWAGTPSPLMHPALSRTHYFQAPATQATLYMGQDTLMVVTCRYTCTCKLIYNNHDLKLLHDHSCFACLNHCDYEENNNL